VDGNAVDMSSEPVDAKLRATMKTKAYRVEEAGGFVWVWLLRKVTAQAIGILAYIEPVSAALLAWAILDQPLGWPVIAGGCLIIAAGVLVVLYEPADAAAVEAVPVPAERAELG
jgi:hypothetical protein